MTSSNAITEPAPVVDVQVGHTRAADGAAVDTADGAAVNATVNGGKAAQANTSPFELLPAGETFGVCDLDGECR